MDVPGAQLTGNVKQNSVNVSRTLKTLRNYTCGGHDPGLHLALKGPRSSADIKASLALGLNNDAAIDLAGLDNALRDWAAWQKESLKSAVR